MWPVAGGGFGTGKGETSYGEIDRLLVMDDKKHHINRQLAV